MIKQTIISLFVVWLVISFVGCNTPSSSTPHTTTTTNLTTTPNTSHTPSTTVVSTTPPKTSTATIPPNTTTAAVVTDPLVQYMLELINQHRTQNGLMPVSYANNQAAQNHAEDMLKNYYLSHWDTDGQKPYMRYTIEGGINAEGENSAYYGWFDQSEDASRYVTIDPKQILEDLENQMMFDDAASNWGHRDNILNKRHKKVNIGIAYDDHRLALVQQFEGDYINFTQLPRFSDGNLTASGKISLGDIDSVTVYYDPLPKPMTQSELVNGPHYYSMGIRIATILPPPPPGYAYSNLPENTFQAVRWDVDDSGTFSIQAELGTTIEQNGSGVYTVVFRSKDAGEYILLSNYSVVIP
jgi:uncharacterized protein YkwD